jgi:drug/metabolite transporter (DMT)-like permease
MDQQHLAYLLGLGSATLFSGASVIFARYSVRYSSLWMNFAKNLLAGLAFIFVAAGWALISGVPVVSGASVFFLLASGVIGLSIGDYFLFRGYRQIGSARSLMIFSFSPLFLSLQGYLFFGQSLKTHHFVALGLMMSCVWVLSWEKFRSEGHWEWKGICFALLGVLLDNLGIVLSRKAFDASADLDPITANAIRSLGALIVLIPAVLMWERKPWEKFWQLGRKERLEVVGASFFGTFLSLTLWLSAVRIGHIGSLAGVGSFNPVAASLWEWALDRRRPTPHLLLALALFLSGFSVLLWGD